MLLKGIATLILGSGLFTTFGALPSTTTYQLNSFGFGSGGGANTTTPNYSLEGITGEISNKSASTTTYSTLPGYIQTQQANVPKVTLTNPASYYNKLKFVIDQQSNPSDALYALQVKAGDPSCDFTTGTLNYIKSDDTIGSTLTTADYQNYAAWGSASGTLIVGLNPSTTYCVRTKAAQHLFSQSGGRYTESAYGPSSSVATVSQALSFCIYTNANCAAGGGSVSFSGLVSGSVTNGSSNIGVDFDTNANYGGSVYVYSLNGGLHTAHANYTINSATANLDLSSEGFGAKVTSASQSSGGPFVAVSPYAGASNNVGVLATTVNTILNSSGAAVGSGTGSIQLKVLAANTTPEASDYAETLTFIAAAAF